MIPFFVIAKMDSRQSIFHNNCQSFWLKRSLFGMDVVLELLNRLGVVSYKENSWVLSNPSNGMAN